MATAKLKVSLNPALDPPVIISDRKYNAKGKSKIRWEKDDDVHDFTIKGLYDLDQSLFNRQSINLDRTRFSCRNRAPEGETEYSYELVVSWNGTEYSSTESGPGPSGRPVIRN